MVRPFFFPNNRLQGSHKDEDVPSSLRSKEGRKDGWMEGRMENNGNEI